MLRTLIIIFIVSTNFCYGNGKVTNKKSKMTIEADKIVLKDRKKVAFFYGNVIYRNGEITIQSDRMSVKYDEKLTSDKSVKIKDIYAYGNVKFNNGKMIVTGDRGNYNLVNYLITIEDNVVMNNDDVIALGNKLTYNILTDDTKMDDIKKQEKDKKRVIIILDDINKIKDEYDIGK